MIFIYRCRLCGELDKCLHCGNNNSLSESRALMHLVNAVSNNVSEIQAPRLLSLHSCANGKTGVSDLIGMERE